MSVVARNFQAQSAIEKLSGLDRGPAHRSAGQTKMTSEIPRDTDQLDHHDEDEHGHGGEQSDHTCAGADPEEREDQKKGNET